MEIYAKCKYDYESVKALTHVAMYRIVRPKTAFLTMIIMCTIGLGLEIFSGISWGMEAIDFGLLALLIVLTGLTSYMYLGVPKMQYKALGKMKNVENEYIFCDEVIKVISKSEEYNAEGEFQYSIIPKVIETSKYLFVYQSKNNAFIIDKSTVANGTIDDIREKLTRYVKKKYFIYRY